MRPTSGRTASRWQTSTPTARPTSHRSASTNRAGPSGVAVLLNKGDGTFRSAGDAPFPGVYGLAVGDFNRDGWVDAVGVSFGHAPYGPWVTLNDKVWA